LHAHALQDYYRPAFGQYWKGNDMRGIKLSALILSVALAACAKGGDQDEAAATGGEPSTTTAETAAPAPATQTSGSAPQGATAEDVTAGQQIFTATGNCYTCHGPDAKGTPLAPNLTDAEWINIGGTFAEIQTVVKNGVPTPKQHPAPMPAMGGANLSDDQVRQVAAYVWSLGGGK
jgi:mono/diheme cytochrome c family protein